MENSKSNLNEQDKLNTVLKEYEALRSEIIKCSDRQLQLFYILMLILSAACGYIIAYRTFDILCIIPILISPFIFRYIWEQRNVEAISKYMKEEIEGKRIPSIVGYRCGENGKNYERYWIGWQHYYEDIGIASPHKHLALLLIVLISFVPSIIYSILFIISPYTSISIQSSIATPLHILALIAYILLPIYFSKTLGLNVLFLKGLKK